jgi:hypothetical protein
MVNFDSVRGALLVETQLYITPPTSSCMQLQVSAGTSEPSLPPSNPITRGRVGTVTSRPPSRQALVPSGTALTIRKTITPTKPTPFTFTTNVTTYILVLISLGTEDEILQLTARTDKLSSRKLDAPKADKSVSPKADTPAKPVVYTIVH